MQGSSRRNTMTNVPENRKQRAAEERKLKPSEEHVERAAKERQTDSPSRGSGKDHREAWGSKQGYWMKHLL